MKILKVLLYILLVLVLVLVLLGFVGPKSYDVSRTTHVNASAAQVAPYLQSLKKQNEWGPWRKQDPDMQITYEGEDGTVGFVSKWDGKVAGKGQQTITSVMGNTVETELIFYMPWGESKSTGYMHAADADGGSEVTWGIRGENDFIGRIFGVFMNMDKSVGPMFDEGLQSLKQLIESDLSKKPEGYKVTTIDFAARQYIAARSTVQIQDISTYFGTHFGRIAEAIVKSGVEMDGPPTGLYFSWDEANGATDMAAAIPVKSAVKVPNTEMITLGAGKALVIDYYGKYEESEKAHTAMDEYIKASGLKTKMPVLEEYVTDPESEPDPQKWLTRIYYLLDQ